MCIEFYTFIFFIYSMISTHWFLYKFNSLGLYFGNNILKWWTFRIIIWLGIYNFWNNEITSIMSLCFDYHFKTFILLFHAPFCRFLFRMQSISQLFAIRSWYFLSTQYLMQYTFTLCSQYYCVYFLNYKIQLNSITKVSRIWRNYRVDKVPISSVASRIFYRLFQ